MVKEARSDDPAKGQRRWAMKIPARITAAARPSGKVTISPRMSAANATVRTGCKNWARTMRVMPPRDRAQYQAETRRASHRR